MRSNNSPDPLFKLFLRENAVIGVNISNTGHLRSNIAIRFYIFKCRLENVAHKKQVLEDVVKEALWSLSDKNTPKPAILATSQLPQHAAAPYDQ